jgi:hypothetical protein
VRIIRRSEDTGGALALVQQRSQPGAGIPLHINPQKTEFRNSVSLLFSQNIL